MKISTKIITIPSTPPPLQSKGLYHESFEFVYFLHEHLGSPIGTCLISKIKFDFFPTFSDICGKKIRISPLIKRKVSDFRLNSL